jgi:alginate O-acetyltransferase complex protein AlgI
MLFCSQKFLLFFLIVFAVYWLLPRQRLRVLLLVAASFVFYASWSRWLALLLAASCVLDYCLALGMEATASQRLRRLLLLVSLVANLGLLVYFKYANFFLRSLEESVHVFGLDLALPVLRVILPVGISFYTFEAINYTVDVYLGRIRAERRLDSFMLFILFFPHLMAGPIVRARDFLPQTHRPKQWSWLRGHAGLMLILVGLIKKLAIADRMGYFYVEPIFHAPDQFGALALWVGAVAYAFQVYCDFSGYTDMALGLAQLLGYHLAPNFNLPFLAVNVSDFWRRWHISLSTWIRDYLYIPLGGSRRGRWITYRNLLLTMTLAGLWHGANWNCVLFGFLQGLMLALHSVFRSWCASRPRLTALLESGPGTAARIGFTFFTFFTSLAVFRSEGLANAWIMLSRMFTFADGADHPMYLHGFWLTALAVLLAHLVGRDLPAWRRRLERIPAPLQGLGFGAVLTLALLLAPQATKAFIYFQF